MKMEKNENRVIVEENDDDEMFDHRELMSWFEPLTEQEQQYLLFGILDMLNFYNENMKEYRDKGDKEQYKDCDGKYQLLQFIMTCLVNPKPTKDMPYNFNAKEFNLQQFKDGYEIWKDAQNKKLA